MKIIKIIAAVFIAASFALMIVAVNKANNYFEYSRLTTDEKVRETFLAAEYFHCQDRFSDVTAIKAMKSADWETVVSIIADIQMMQVKCDFLYSEVLHQSLIGLMYRNQQLNEAANIIQFKQLSNDALRETIKLLRKEIKDSTTKT